MEKVNHYRQILKEVLHEFTNVRNNNSDQTDVETQLLIDTENDHYQVLYAGWHQSKQIFSVIFHFDIIDGKIWVQRNISDYDIIEDIEQQFSLLNLFLISIQVLYFFGLFQ